MIKMFYQMMAKGKTKHVRLLGKVYALPEGLEWHVPYYSPSQYVIALDEEACLNKIRQKMQLKYDGFRIVHVQSI